MHLSRGSKERTGIRTGAPVRRACQGQRLRIRLPPGIRYLLSSHLCQSWIQGPEGVPIRGDAGPLRKSYHTRLQGAQDHSTSLLEALTTSDIVCSFAGRASYDPAMIGGNKTSKKLGYTLFLRGVLK